MSMQKIRRRRIGEMLVSEGLVTPDQLAEALERQKDSGESIGEVLLHDKLVSEADIVRTICVQYQVPYISPRLYDRQSDLADKFDADFLYKNRILPLDRVGDSVILAIGDIPTEETEEKLLAELGPSIFYYFSTSSEIKQVLIEHFSLSQDDLSRYESSRDAAMARQAQAGAGDSQLLETLDSSWESIFDEAEQNISE